MQHDELITEGAAGYAALDWTSYATNRLNIGSADVWGRYKAFADERLKQFRADLVRLGRSNAVRLSRMYSTDAPSVFEQNRVKISSRFLPTTQPITGTAETTPGGRRAQLGVSRGRRTDARSSMTKRKTETASTQT